MWHRCRQLYCFPYRSEGIKPGVVLSEWSTTSQLSSGSLRGADGLCQVGVYPELHCHRRSLRRILNWYDLHNSYLGMWWCGDGAEHVLYAVLYDAEMA